MCIFNTLCLNTTNGFKCGCPKDHYFNYYEYHCENANSTFNQSCNHEHPSCDTQLGLKCLNGFCK
jgi:hypothetical protein